MAGLPRGFLPGRSPLTRLAAGAFASLAVLLASTNVPALASHRGVDRLFDAAFSVLLPAATPRPLPDLNDGRSAVSARWRDSLARFAQSDADHPPAAGGIVFVGSSSISLWKGLESQFAPAEVTRRGLGGARMSDCLHYLDRLVLPYTPRLVVVYAGDNDLAEGVSPQAVLADYIALVGRVHDELPDARIAFVSVKPSPSREALAPLVRRTNALIAAYTRNDRQLDYIDIHSRMLDASGRARPELFQPDGLHPNAAGYAVWQTVIADHLR